MTMTSRSVPFRVLRSILRLKQSLKKEKENAGIQEELVPQLAVQCPGLTIALHH